MVAQRHLTISGFHFSISGGRADTQDTVSILQVRGGRRGTRTAHAEHLLQLRQRNAQVYRDFPQGIYLLCHHHSICLGQHHQEAEQLQALLVRHIGRYLSAAVTDDGAVLLHSHLVLLLEKLQQYLLPLHLRRHAEVVAQEAAHSLHLRVHHLAICLDDIGSQHQKGKHE